MSVVTTLADGYYRLVVGDKTYRVKSVIDQQFQADFARWHFQRAVADLLAVRDLYTPEEYDAERLKLREGMRKGEFDFKTKKSLDILVTIPAILFLFTNLVEGVAEVEAMDVLSTCADQFRDLVQMIFESSFPEALKRAAEAKKKMTENLKVKKTVLTRKYQKTNKRTKSH